VVEACYDWRGEHLDSGMETGSPRMVNLRGNGAQTL